MQEHDVLGERREVMMCDSAVPCKRHRSLSESARTRLAQDPLY